MLYSLHISAFRCFRELRVRPLARVIVVDANSDPDRRWRFGDG